MSARRFVVLIAVAAGCGSDPGSDQGVPTTTLHPAELTCGQPAAASRLVFDGLSPDLLADGLPSPFDRQPTDPALMRYLTRCALPAGAQLFKVDAAGDKLCFPGQLGLAPGWASGACDGACEETLSACLMALANRDQRRVNLELTAVRPSVLPTASREYPNQEGMFFGNLFTTPPQLLVCGGSDVTRAAQAKRFCVGEGGCRFVKVGACADACTQAGCRDTAGRLWTRPVAVQLKNRLEAANFDHRSGVVSFGQGIKDVDDGDWISFKSVDFGADGSVTTFAASIATPNFGNEIEAWLDSPTGRYLGTILTQKTSPDWERLLETEQSTKIKTAGISGLHTVYIHFDGPVNTTAANGLGQGIGRFTHFEFR